MKTFAPEGATHYKRGFNGSKIYFISYDNEHFVWLGLKHGGWSTKVPYQYPNHADLIKLDEKDSKWHMQN